MSKKWKMKEVLQRVQFFILNFLIVMPKISAADMVDLEHFGQELFHTLASKQPQHDQLITPLPLATLLILLRANAEVSSAHEVSEHLGLIGKSNEVIHTNYEDYLRKMDKTKRFTMSNNISIVTSQIAVENLKFSIRETIKKWRTLKLCYKTADLTNSGYKSELVLESKIHFNNAFQYRLSPVTKGFFQTINGVKIEKEMLQHIAEIRYGTIPALRATAVEVPYSDGYTFLMILIPHNPKGVLEMEKYLKSFPMGSINSYLRRKPLKLVLPKFRTNVLMSVKNAFQKLGIRSMFDRLCDTTPFISVADIMYRASFGINEKTAGVESSIGNVDEIPEIRVEHPFIFLIKSITNDIYLWGKIMK